MGSVSQQTPRRRDKKWACVSQRTGYVSQEESEREEQVRGCKDYTLQRELEEARGRRRDHYLSAPGREAATFGRGGGAGGFKLNYGTKTKKDRDDTNIDGHLTKTETQCHRERSMGREMSGSIL